MIFCRHHRLLFVCSGNICRSPVAEHLAARLLAASTTSSLAVTSAGLMAVPGDRPNADTLQAASELGLDLSRHRARRLASLDLHDGDLVLVMEHQQRDSILAWSRLPPASIRLLGSIPPQGSEEIPDPGGLPARAYGECFARIRDAVEHLIMANVAAPGRA